MSVSPKILPDDHDAMIELFLDAVQQHMTVSGVVHVGAHRGQEVEHYRSRGIENIVLIEANPVHCEFLEAQYRGDSGVTVVNCAVSDIDGFVDLHVNVSRTGNDESSSILELRRLSEIVPTLKTARTIQVPSRTLDTLASGGLFANCNFMSIDIQGAELRALRGGRLALRDMQAILIETNVIEMYDQCALQPQIDACLESSGFTCVERVYHELYEGDRRFPAWGESLYVRG